jgi:GAF domain-containing protein
MTENVEKADNLAARRLKTTVLVLADVETNAQALIDRILTPAGITAHPAGPEAPDANVLVVDVTQLRGDPLAGLRNLRTQGIRAPAIVMAAHFPAAWQRDLFRLGTRDVLLKPYKPVELCEAIIAVAETYLTEGTTQKLSRRVAEMQEIIRRRSEEIRLLSEIGRSVASLDELEEILTRVVEAAAYVTDAEEASIYLLDEETNTLLLRASKYAGERHATLQSLRVEDTLVGEVYSTGKSVLRQPSMESGPLKVQTGFLVQSLINVPLRTRNNVVGVLGVYNRMISRSFTEHHRTVLLALSDWAGIGLEHAMFNQVPTPLATSPAQPEQPEAEMSLPGIPAQFIEEIRVLAVEMDQIRNGSHGPLSNELEGALRDMQDRLVGLQTMPVTTIGANEIAQLVDLPALIDEVLKAYEADAARKKVEIILELGERAPLFHGDSERISKVIETILAAAIRRTSQGRVLVQLHRFSVRGGKSGEMPLPWGLELLDGPWAAVTIADTSSGLSPDTVRAISADQTDPSAGQVGPGLSMGETRMIVESMGGVLWFEQTPASTTVAFAIPAE